MNKNKILKSIFYFFFPKKCYNCQNVSGNDLICDSCKLMYKDQFKTGILSDFNFKTNLLYASYYEFLPKKLILDFKYNKKKKNIPDFFLNYLDQDPKFREYIKKQKYITYIPTSMKNINRRSYDQAKVLAEKISEKYGIKMLDLIIKKESKNKEKQTNNEDDKENKIEIKEQKILSREERMYNVRDNFKVIKERVRKLEGNILVVDDIYTTGSTAYEVQRILKEENKNLNIYFFTLCYTKI